MPRGDILFAHAAVMLNGLEGAELIERMQTDPLVDILRARESSSAIPPSRMTQGTGCVLAIRFCLTRSSRRAIVASAGGHLEHTGLVAVGIDDRTNAQALQQRGAERCSRPVARSRTPAFYAADVGLAQHQLVERNIAGGTGA